MTIEHGRYDGIKSILEEERDEYRKREEIRAEIANRYVQRETHPPKVSLPSFILGVVVGVALTFVLLFVAGCKRRETPITASKHEPALRRVEAKTAAAEKSAREALEASRDALAYVESVQPNVHPLTPDELRATAKGSAPVLRRAQTRMVSFASPAVQLQVFRVDGQPVITLDGRTYNPARFAWVAIDIADTLREENACLFAVWQQELSIGTCYWPATFGRGKWMVIPIDTSPVVEFRRLAGPSIIPAVRISELKPISAGELK